MAREENGNPMEKGYDQDSHNSEEKAYDNLYDGLPQDVVDLLRETHPLMGSGARMRNDRTEKTEKIDKVEKDEKAERSDRSDRIEEGRPTSRRRHELDKKAQEEVQRNSAFEEMATAVPRKRSAQRAPKYEFEKDDAVKESLREYDQGYEEIAQHSRTRRPAPSSSEEPKSRPRRSPRDEDEDESDRIQMVKVKTPVRKGREPQHRQANYLDMDRITQEETLNEFFRDNAYHDEDDYPDPNRRKNIVMIVLIVFVVVFFFLLFRTVTLSGRLNQANDQIASLTQMQTENEQLKLDIVALEEELNNYRNAQTNEEDTTQTTTEEGNETQSTDSQGTQTDQNTTTTTTPTTSTYTVQAGDTLGTISQQVYGSFRYYTNIAEANGISADANLQIGQVLQIPDIQQ